tara:strand:+ start:4764 stop:5789 length:1026 start_codon:yes stop_codon:yes gene_type:complete
MFSNEQKIKKFFLYWLVTSLILVFLIIIVGGLTRLTNSGLSITEWELFRGILPPLNNSEWIFYFDQYKQIPQYKLLNFNMSLEEFKVIFYWEYYHRILARFIGIFFLIPLIYFHFTKKIKKEYMNICYVIFSLIVLQGIIGWFMVKSGLVNVTTVSHYRLSIHLITAILIISCIFWLIKNVVSNKSKIFFKFSIDSSIYQICILLIYIQIMMGAFVSGLDAGQIYQTWPMMGDKFIPNDLHSQKLINIADFNNHSLVQFYHRNLAYILVIYILFLAVLIYKNKSINLYNPIKIMLFFLFLQISLGIFTLVSGLNIYLASAHQITSILLVFSALNLYFFKVK